MSLPFDPTNLFQPLVDLYTFIAGGRRKDRANRAAAVASLRVIQMELAHDWSAIKEAQEIEGGAQFVTNTMTPEVQNKLAAGLPKQAKLIDDINACYGEIPLGRTQLPSQLWSEETTVRYRELYDSLTRVWHSINNVLHDGKLVPDELTDAECAPQAVWRMFQDARLARSQVIAIEKKWSAFCDGLDTGTSHIYGLAEVATMRAEAGFLGPVKVQERAAAAYPDAHSFERLDRIYEFWVSERVRLIHGVSARGIPIILDLATLNGPETADWLLEYRLKRAACRLTRLYP